jgi:hypothetical protein
MHSAAAGVCIGSDSYIYLDWMNFAPLVHRWGEACPKLFYAFSRCRCLHRQRFVYISPGLDELRFARSSVGEACPKPFYAFGLMGISVCHLPLQVFALAAIHIYIWIG